MNNFKKYLEEELLTESNTRVSDSNVSIKFDPNGPNVVFVPPQSGVVEFSTEKALNSVIKILTSIKKELR